MEPLSGRNFRLLRLKPGKLTEPLIGRLDISPLDSKVVYTALSYVWGTAQATHTITLNGDEFRIRPNLYNALRRVRSCDSEITIWADAICIDQTNDIERAHQVGMMRDIFRLCTEALMYLGEPPSSVRAKKKRRRPTTTPPLESTETGALAHIKAMVGSGCLTDKAPFPTDIKTVENTTQEDIFEQIRDLLQSSWWTRIWTVQEVCLPSVVTFMYGSERLRWELITNAVSNILKHSQSCCLQRVRRLPTAYTKVLVRLCEEVESIRSHRSSSRSDLEPVGTLLLLLRNFHKRRAHDERDKIFALLGLIHEIPPGIEVDYTLSSTDVFVHTARSCIESTQSLYVLILASGSKYHGDLPSWVPDFAVSDYRMTTTRDEHYHLYEASAGALYNIQPVVRGVLEVEAVQLGLVADYSEPLNFDDFQSCRDTILRWSLLGWSPRGQLSPSWSELPRVEDCLQWTPKAFYQWTIIWTRYTGPSFHKLLCGETIFDSKLDVWRRLEPLDVLRYHSWLVFSRLSCFSALLLDLHSLLRQLKDEWILKFPTAAIPSIPTILRDDHPYKSHYSKYRWYRDFVFSLLASNEQFSLLIDHWWELDIKLAEDFDLAIEAATSNRRAFRWRDPSVSGEGADLEGLHWGIGPSQIEMGDVVAVLAGGRCPFVLRPARHGESLMEDLRQMRQSEGWGGVSTKRRVEWLRRRSTIESLDLFFMERTPSKVEWKLEEISILSSKCEPHSMRFRGSHDQRHLWKTPCWTVVGPCVLPNFMQGERWDEQELSSIWLV